VISTIWRGVKWRRSSANCSSLSRSAEVSPSPRRQSAARSRSGEGGMGGVVERTDWSLSSLMPRFLPNGSIDVASENTADERRHPKMV